MKKKVNKLSYIILFILIMFEGNCWTQSYSFEQVALDYFCNRVTTKYSKVVDSGIIYTGFSTGEYTKAFDAKICDEDLNYLLYPIPDSAYLDSVDQTMRDVNALEIELDKNSRIFNFKKNTPFELFVNNAILYKEFIYVKCEMFNSLNSSYIMILKIDPITKFPIKEYHAFMEYAVP
ncbi:hypothetical protein L21SP5_02183 [Salinivirga cyanobacteriivorans]|uniref:Uncharacterized protein n=1 Tax=Salinivirga cyanobacteriivorans TaxID=1307839 RepID=A0A0S2I0D5_9BACT|nr:hypothetical protein [Salinivirga cyanobacteriivorans]ALO15816.1 hypothetical protein L21SP5_02183 [Salinivirga cyanobacteriivorans]